ncbi:hypothetical protein AgCh_005966 [Apium graveolens]
MLKTHHLKSFLPFIITTACNNSKIKTNSPPIATEKDGAPKVIEGTAPTTKDVKSVSKKPDLKLKMVIQPQTLLFDQPDTISAERPTQSDPVNRKKRPKGREKVLIEASTGQKVLSSDMRLHLNKKQREKSVSNDEKIEVPLEQGDEELLMLEREHRLISEKSDAKRRFYVCIRNSLSCLRIASHSNTRRRSMIPPGFPPNNQHSLSLRRQQHPFSKKGDNEGKKTITLPMRMRAKKQVRSANKPRSSRSWPMI